MISKVLIIGCGYAGSAIGAFLSQHGYDVTATTRSIEHATLLQKSFVKAYALDIHDQSSLEKAVEDIDAIIITIAPTLGASYEKTYLKCALALSEIAKKTPSLKSIIYTSASSVYGDHQGSIVTEESSLIPTSSQAKCLIEAERVLLEISSCRVCIFRLSEIYGPQREISKRVKYYEGKSAPGIGGQHANLIHVDDIANATYFALKHNLQGIYNLSDDDLMTRKEMYDKISEMLSLPKVTWNPAATSIHLGDKIVSNQKIKRAGYSFIYPKRVWI